MGLIYLVLGYLISIFLLICICKSHAQTQVFNIVQFGAVAGGVVDNNQATKNAWDAACGFRGAGIVLVPKGTFLVMQPLSLSGPCHASVQLQIEGLIVASADKDHVKGEYWIQIEHVNNLIIDGGGTLDGQGASVWPLNRCSGSCSGFPVSLKFIGINTATIRNIKSINSKLFHMKVDNSQAITFDKITLLAPGDSPNTDGIHIASSSNINVTNSNIGTGDDCISIGPGSKTINITNVNCGPGHGISIGSLGKYAEEEDVVGVTVQNSFFTGTMNGVRIKSWSTSFSSLVSNIVFIHLQMNNVENPIIIDQSYCPSCAQKQKSMSRVQIKDVRYEDIRGTSNTKVAVDFECSQVAPCQGIVLKDINLGFNGGGSTTSTCFSVKGFASGQELPPPCF